MNGDQREAFSSLLKRWNKLLIYIVIKSPLHLFYRRHDPSYVRKNLCNLLNSSSCYTVLPKKLDMSYSDCNSNGNSTAASICDNSDDEHISMTKLLQDNRELRSKLSLMKSLEQENQILRQELNLLRNSVDDDKLKQLLESRNEIQRLEHEKSALQDTLRFLQNEASKL